MRLNKQYVQVIKKSFNDVFQKGEIYLFGSRVDDSKKGGDIDLFLVIENKINIFKKKLKFLAKIKKELGEQKIDIIFNFDENRLIEKEARAWGIKL
ncbi:MAG: nucleotidyltransferase domain-containing protein [Gammaproteobacteria bacterium]|nr:MAG: nucleotidyltransferase domain-containing protein [Gammaproteobacteria bacterium]